MRNTPWYLVLMAFVFIVTGLVGTASAKSTYLTLFNNTYPSATYPSTAAIRNCSLCHPNSVTSQFNPFATDFKNAGHLFAPIETKDSDADGFTNIAEITAGTYPGLATSKPVVAVTLSSIAISGPASLNENSTASYSATATMSDNSTKAVTATWSENSAYTTISAAGALTATAVTADQTVTVSANYTEGGITKTASKSVVIIDVPEQACTDLDGDGFAIEGGSCGAVDPDDTNPLITPTSGKTPLNDTTEFVKQLYWDLLNRDGDAGGVLYWVNQIDTGKVTKGQATDSFHSSPEFQHHVPAVTRLYLAYFHRSPDFDGLMYWATHHAQGMSLEEISQNFAVSQEFLSTYGNLDNAQFVELVYQNVLGRNSDPEGLNFWTNQLDTGNLSRGQVMVGFSESLEYQTHSQTEVFVSTAFITLLRRAPSQAEYDYWVINLNAGNPRLGLIDNLLNSSEYAARFAQ